MYPIRGELVEADDGNSNQTKSSPVRALSPVEGWNYTHSMFLTEPIEAEYYNSIQLQ
jgi:hypothetical protein